MSTISASTGSDSSATRDRKSVVEGKRGDLGGRRIIKKKKNKDRACSFAWKIIIKQGDVQIIECARRTYHKIYSGLRPERNDYIRSSHTVSVDSKFAVA